MRPTTLIQLAGLAVVGMIAADVWAHPQGTKAAADGIVAVTKPAEQALLGSVPK